MWQVIIIEQCSARDAGVSIVMEVGLDPGIDHMLAMECFHDIKSRGGEVAVNCFALRFLKLCLATVALFR